MLRMERLLIVPMLISLGGCGLPPAISAISWAIDGVSMIASGKTVTDHAISAVAQQDCALWRVIKDEPICHDEIFDAGKMANAQTMVRVADEFSGEIMGGAPPMLEMVAPVKLQDGTPVRIGNGSLTANPSAR